MPPHSAYCTGKWSWSSAAGSRTAPNALLLSFRAVGRYAEFLRTDEVIGQVSGRTSRMCSNSLLRGGSSNDCRLIKPCNPAMKNQPAIFPTQKAAHLQGLIPLR